MRFLSSLVLALIVVAASEAQTDLGKVLVGKWQGDVQLGGRGDPNRTLVIESVSEKDGKWVAAGRYGVTGKGFGKVQINVDKTGQWPSIRFVTGANSTVDLNLVDEKSMVGKMTLLGARGGGSDRSMRLQKAE